MDHVVVTLYMKTTKSRKQMSTLSRKNENYLCMSCDKIVAGEDTVIYRDQILCLFCATIEGSYYGRPNEYLPDEYYTWLKEEDEKNGSTES